MKQLTESPNNNEDSDDEGGGWAGGRELPHFEEIQLYEKLRFLMKQAMTYEDQP